MAESFAGGNDDPGGGVNDYAAFETWLTQATRHLSRDAAAQVRSEIREHYDAARENAMERGSSSEEADRLALEALGDAKAANRQYRKVMLTSGEARLLREGNWEAGAVCSRRWLIPVSALVAAVGFYLAGSIAMARLVLVGGTAIALLFFATSLPVYTPARSRIFRGVRWLVLAGILLLAFWPMTFQWSGLLFSCVWPVAWVGMDTRLRSGGSCRSRSGRSSCICNRSKVAKRRRVD